MTDLKLPELPEDLQAWERDFNCQYSTRYERPDVARILADWRASLTAYATAAVLAERAAAEADARRYRWLRDSASGYQAELLVGYRSRDNWDAYIDAALQADTARAEGADNG